MRAGYALLKTSSNFSWLVVYESKLWQCNDNILHWNIRCLCEFKIDAVKLSRQTILPYSCINFFVFNCIHNWILFQNFPFPDQNRFEKSFLQPLQPLMGVAYSESLWGEGGGGGGGGVSQDLAWILLLPCDKTARMEPEMRTGLQSPSPYGSTPVYFSQRACSLDTSLWICSHHAFIMTAYII